VLAQHGLGDAERLAGRRQAAVLDDLGEEPDVVEVLHVPCLPEPIVRNAERSFHTFALL
jgi:hypothetical protein